MSKIFQRRKVTLSDEETGESSSGKLLTVGVENESPLEDGMYIFMEQYCDNPKCKCKEVIISVIHHTEGKKAREIGMFTAAWEKSKIGLTWKCKPYDDKQDGELVNKLIELFKCEIHRSKSYAREILKRHKNAKRQYR